MGPFGVNEWERSGSVPEFLVIYRYLSSKKLVTRSEQQPTRTYKKRKTTTSKQCPSEHQRIPANAKMSPNFPVRWHTLGQFVIVWRGLNASLKPQSIPLSRMSSRRSDYGLAEGAGDKRSVTLDYAPEVHPSGEVCCGPWSRDKWCHPQSWDSLSGFIL